MSKGLEFMKLTIETNQNKKQEVVILRIMYRHLTSLMIRQEEDLRTVALKIKILVKYGKKIIQNIMEMVVGKLV
jgi:hypothetical protein